LLWPGNSSAAQVTVTRVTIEPGGGQPCHSHPASEQIWIIEHGAADMLLAGGQTRSIRAGDVVRTPAGEIHGLHNGGIEPFIYLAIIAPPLDFRSAYECGRQPRPLEKANRSD
jgi:quercetin dioxygenase-like cupin family protein